MRVCFYNDTELKTKITFGDNAVTFPPNECVLQYDYFIWFTALIWQTQQITFYVYSSSVTNMIVLALGREAKKCRKRTGKKGLQCCDVVVSLASA